MQAITLKGNIGIGDKIQFTSLPENYFRSFGVKLVDVSESWVFDYNPYVQRAVKYHHRPKELWNFPQLDAWPVTRSQRVYQSLAEIHAARFGAKVFLNRPRLYKYEDFPFEKRSRIILQTNGRSHGNLPPHIIKHVIKKYGSENLYHLGTKGENDYGLKPLRPPTLWSMCKEISQCRMLIGPDSGPSWIASCYADVIVKKVRLRTYPRELSYEEWVPLSVDNHHSHWDDRCAQIFVDREDDQGSFWSYKKI